jgi:hypothetical protein
MFFVRGRRLKGVTTIFSRFAVSFMYSVKLAYVQALSQHPIWDAKYFPVSTKKKQSGHNGDVAAKYNATLEEYLA